MRTSMENGNVNGKENHSGQAEGSVEDVNISALHWTEFTGELKLQYFVATAGPTHNWSPWSESPDYLSLIVKAKF